jgi:hypothetical protein
MSAIAPSFALGRDHRTDVEWFAGTASSLRRSYRLPLRLTCDAGGVSKYRVRFEGPAAFALSVATALADADGIELISSDQPVAVDENIVALNVTVEGEFDAVADAVASVRGGMPTEASIEISSG